jgi:DNA modification methylase
MQEIMQQENLFPIEIKQYTARQINIINSPKQSGHCDIDSEPYLKQLGIDILNKKQPIQFSPNVNEAIHRWAPYVQGFSASFVQSVFDQYKYDYNNPTILDPFTGCGTVQVQSKLNGYKSIGTELNPLLKFIADTKLNTWDVSPKKILNVFNKLDLSKPINAPRFLKSEKHFSKEVLRNLEILKGGIDNLSEKIDPKVIDLLELAFSSILVDVSNLKRSPCLGYSKSKKIDPHAPFVLMNQKVNQIIEDLRIIQNEYNDFISTSSKVLLANSMEYNHSDEFDLVITSPPYMNGLDYVINYKIEMGWLNFANNQIELKKVKDEMVVCDNVSKGLIRNFTPVYTNDWIEDIKRNIQKNILRRGKYRRQDMFLIVHKYFDDMYKVFKMIVPQIKNNGRFILVVGDSLIADVYVPSDLIIAQIGKDLGLNIEKIEKARNRRSGQIRSYKLRETIITLRK